MNKKLYIPALALILIGGAALVNNVSAHGFSTGDDTMIERLAEAFGKSEDEVQGVFEDLRAERQTEMQLAIEDRLSEAVSAGDLTEDQKQLILAKHQELQTQHEQQFAKRQQQHQELQTWAEENGISLRYLFGGRGFHGGNASIMHQGMHPF